MTLGEIPAVVVRNEPLEEAHIPADLVNRGAQIEQLRAEIAPPPGKPIGHAWLWGRPGSGKTATARLVVGRLAQETPTGVAYVNCLRAGTAYLALARAIGELCKGLRILPRDDRRDALSRLDILAQEATRRRLVLVLDEFDLLSEPDRAFLLTTLPELRNVGVVCVAGSCDALVSADERVRSRFRPVQIEFPRYPKDDIVAILAARAAAALTLGSYNAAQLARIAEIADGDARIAIQTLHRAANLSDRRGEAFLTDAAIEEAAGAMHDIRREYALRRLTSNHRLLHDLVAREKEITANDLWLRYLQHARSYGLEPIALRTFRKYMNLDLAKARLVTVRAGGPWRKRFTYRVAG